MRPGSFARSVRRRAAFVILASLAILAIVFSSCSAARGGSTTEPGGTIKSAGADVASQAIDAQPPGAPAATPAMEGYAMEPAMEAEGRMTADIARSNAFAPWDRKVIRSVNLSMAAQDVEKAVVQARSIVAAADGYVATSQTYYDQDRLIATMTFQVPSANFDRVVNQLRGLATKVDSESGSSDDVTEEFVDLEAQVKNLRMTEASLQQLMDRATRVEEILVINRELSEIRSQIERIQGRLNYIGRRTEFASITTQIYPPPVVTPLIENETAWDPARTAQRAFENSLLLVQGAADLAITLVVFFWWLIPLALIVIPIIRLLGWPRQTVPPSTPAP